MVLFCLKLCDAMLFMSTKNAARINDASWFRTLKTAAVEDGTKQMAGTNGHVGISIQFCVAILQRKEKLPSPKR